MEDGQNLAADDSETPLLIDGRERESAQSSEQFVYVSDVHSSPNNNREVVRTQEENNNSLSLFEELKFSDKKRTDEQPVKNIPRKKSFVLPTVKIDLNKREMNILFIGPSSHGKSTLVNAIRILLGFTSLSSAVAEAANESEDREKLILAPQRLCFEDDNRTKHILDAKSEFKAEEENFDSTQGESCTQWPANFELEFKNLYEASTVIRIIDSPGINDTQNRDEQIQNAIIEKIMQYGTIDLICIVLKATEQLFDDKFRESLKKVFDNFPNEIGSNVFLCYTNYQYGASIPTEQLMERYLGNLQRSANSTIGNKIAKFNNLFVQFVLAKRLKRHVKIDGMVRRLEVDFTDAREELFKLLKCADKTMPYDVIDSVSLAYARTLSKIVQIPAVDITCSINDTRMKMKSAEREIGKIQASLDNQLFIINSARQIETHQIDISSAKSPHHVCLSPSCKQKLSRGEDIQCCEDCWMSDGSRLCYRIGFFSKVCRTCGCEAAFHMHVIRKCIRNPITVDDDEMKEVIAEFYNETNVVDKEKMLNEIKARTIEKREKRLREYREEVETIANICALLQVFLQHKSFNKFMVEDKFDLYLKAEQVKIYEGKASELFGYYSQIIRYYEQMKEKHYRVRHNISNNDVIAVVERLKGLKHSGEEFKKLIDLGLAERRERKAANTVQMSTSLLSCYTRPGGLKQ